MFSAVRCGARAPATPAARADGLYVVLKVVDDAPALDGVLLTARCVLPVFETGVAAGVGETGVGREPLRAASTVAVGPTIGAVWRGNVCNLRGGPLAGTDEAKDKGVSTARAAYALA